MTESHTKARFWKCALQVNPAGYIAYRGTDHGMTEAQYNQELLCVAKENGIKVIGLADHGNVDGVDAIRILMNDNGIVVFPGFEIETSEKAHFVCLFPENTSTTELQRYLGFLELLDPADGVRPSRLSAEQLLKKVEHDLNGFVYAAHCTGDKGVLKRGLNHVWQNTLLKAAQIPGSRDDLIDKDDNGYRKILDNKNAQYKREFPIALINAKDVAKPDDLANPKASCLIKMTTPSFESFKLAFQDPGSRVRLNSEVSEKYYSRIETLTVSGGYLDGVHIEFSEHLNAVIGGRGTGKSTLLECIRYALQIRPIGKNAQKQHDDIIKENLGKAKARVELMVRSAKMNGRCFTVSRRYGESSTVKDEEGKISAFSPQDLLPEIEIYGQNEIYDIAQDATGQRQLLARFLDAGHQHDEARIHEMLGKLAENRKKLIEAHANVAAIEDEVARLPKLEEQVTQFKSLGLEDKLKVIPQLELEKRLQTRAVTEEAQNLNQAFQAMRDSLPDTVFLSDSVIAGLPHTETLRKLRTILDALRADANALLQQWDQKYQVATTQIDACDKELQAGLAQEEAKLETIFREIPAFEGKSGREIGVAFQNLLKDIEKIRPKQALIENRKLYLAELDQQRKSILAELSAARSDRSAHFNRSLKRLNKQLDGKMRLNIAAEADKEPVIRFLLNCHLDGVGAGRLSWIKENDDFSTVRLAELARQGANALRSADWGITPTVADALARLTTEQLLRLEEIELPDVISIELNTSHSGEDHYRPLDRLSAGQKCTAILHLLLLQNVDPLLMDQPEDNLDNAFIADRIVAELRKAKLERQFIFATHNANIPVFGDAEWIGVFEVDDHQAKMPVESQGAIDVPQVRDKAASILEGGKMAFNQRKAKYGF